jgi:uracil phosphoribosyltransferase
MLTILDETPNPALGDLLASLRCRQRQQNRALFRQRLRLIGIHLAFEIGRRIPGRSVDIRTPLGERAVEVPESHPVLATALRAGLPLLEGFQEVYADSDVGFFGAMRVEGAAPAADGSIPISMGYEALPPLRGRTLIFVDPMVATGSTIVDIHRRLVATDQAPARFIVAGVVGWRGAYDRLHAALPDLELVLATCDEELDERGYIVPGLGDAGDLCFGPKI